jgi:hypothetical protein
MHFFPKLDLTIETPGQTRIDAVAPGEERS